MKENKQIYFLIAIAAVVGLAAGLIGGNLALGDSNKVTGNSIYQNTQTLLVRPDNTRADTWIPFTDGSVYLTSDGTKDGGFVFRKWINGSTDTTAKFSNLMVLTSNGNVGIGTMNPKAKLDVNGGVKVNGNLNITRILAYTRSERNNYSYALYLDSREFGLAWINKNFIEERSIVLTPVSLQISRYFRNSVRLDVDGLYFSNGSAYINCLPDFVNKTLVCR